MGEAAADRRGGRRGLGAVIEGSANLILAPRLSPGGPETDIGQTALNNAAGVRLFADVRGQPRRLPVAIFHAPLLGRLVENEGLIMVGGAPWQLGEYVKEQEMLWRNVVHEAGIKIE